MASNFKKQMAQQRAAVPQVDPESINTPVAIPVKTTEAQSVYEKPPKPESEPQEPKQQATTNAYNITIVDTSEAPVNRGFFMYPSRHRQIARDLVYIEDRKPWQIIEDALEEYVVRHYGKEYRRK